jgi:hypothetical protein
MVVRLPVTNGTCPVASPYRHATATILPGFVEVTNSNTGIAFCGFSQSPAVAGPLGIIPNL